MLVAELNHRVKNILAVVQAVASQTMRTAPSLAAFNGTFAGRVQALSIAHDILTRTRWIGIGLSELLMAVLAPYRSADATRVQLSGPPVLLPARAWSRYQWHSTSLRQTPRSTAHCWYPPARSQ